MEATKRSAAVPANAELGPCQSENVAQVPEQRHIGFAIEGAVDAVDLKLDHA
jgi:hypothetical protein